MFHAEDNTKESFTVESLDLIKPLRQHKNKPSGLIN